MQIEGLSGERTTTRSALWPILPTKADALQLERGVAIFALVLVGLRSPWHFGLTTGYVVALLLLPLTLPALASFRWSKLLVVGLAVCLTYGFVVCSWTAESHAITVAARRQSIGIAVGIVVSTILVLWARTIMSSGAIAIAFGIGGILGAHGAASFGDAWKFQYSVSVTVVLLGVAAWRRSTRLAAFFLCLLAAATIFADARSLFTTYLVTGGLLACSHVLQAGRSTKIGVPRVAAVLGLLFGVYKLADALIMSGVLGASARERSMQDVASSGSTLLGGRPELSSTVALMRDHVAGYGLGAIPNTHDVAVGNAALERLGMDPTQNGFAKYMFGRQQYELHSVFGDLWVLFGVAGLVVTALLVILVLAVLASAASGLRVSALLLYLAAATGWNIVSSPLWSSVLTMTLLIGLALPRVQTSSGTAERRAAGG